MEGLIFPIIMLAVTVTGGGLVLWVLTRGREKYGRKGSSSTLLTAQEFINVQDIKKGFLYTMDGFVLSFVRIHSMSIDLYSKTEKRNMIHLLTAELSEVQYPFKFIAVSRPVDISPVIEDMQSMLKDAEDKRKELLRQEILQMSGYALSGEIVERQFYVSLWEKTEEEGIGYAEGELSKRAALLAEKFSGCGIPCEVLGEKEIVRLLNLVHNPSYIHLEDTDYSATIPMLKSGY